MKDGWEAKLERYVYKCVKISAYELAQTKERRRR